MSSSTCAASPATSRTGHRAAGGAVRCCVACCGAEAERGGPNRRGSSPGQAQWPAGRAPACGLRASQRPRRWRRPTALRREGERLVFASPGDDLLCGRPAAYELSTGGGPFRRVGAETVEGGETVSIAVAPRAGRVAVRAVDEEGNRGR